MLVLRHVRPPFEGDTQGTSKSRSNALLLALQDQRPADKLVQ